MLESKIQSRKYRVWETKSYGVLFPCVLRYLCGTTKETGTVLGDSGSLLHLMTYLHLQIMILTKELKKP